MRLNKRDQLPERLIARLVNEKIGSKHDFEHLNKSDHTPVYIQLDVKRNKAKETVNECPNKKKIEAINWNNTSFRESYNKNVDDFLKASKLIGKIYSITNEEVHTLDHYIDELYDGIKSSIDKANETKRHRSKAGEKYRKTNKWWNDELKNIRKRIRHMIKKNKKSQQYKTKFKKLKYEFRKKQRQKIAQIRHQTNRKIVRLEKNKYWSEIYKILKTNKKPEIETFEAGKRFYHMKSGHTTQKKVVLRQK